MKYWIVSLCIAMGAMGAGIAAAADDGYWKKLQAKADALYGGWNVSVVLNTGLEHREYFDRTHTGPYGNVELQVPLYSKERRIEKQKAKADYLQKGAELIRIIDERRERITILQQKAQVLKAAMMDEGAAGIKAYYDCAEDMAKLNAEIREAKKKLEAMLSD